MNHKLYRYLFFLLEDCEQIPPGIKKTVLIQKTDNFYPQINLSFKNNTKIFISLTQPEHFVLQKDI